VTGVTLIYPVEKCILKYKQDGVLDKNRMMDNVQKYNICTNVERNISRKNYMSVLPIPN
jgi:hypothetical protein